MIRLGVNIDHVATLRQARGECYPNPVFAAQQAILAGADNITCHLREDRRHIQDYDVVNLKQNISVPLNLEIADTNEMIEFALKIEPASVTLVPEKREELTTEGGVDLGANKDIYTSIQKLKKNNIYTVLFLEPDLESMMYAKEYGADAVELHTGNFCHKVDKAVSVEQKTYALKELINAANKAHKCGLKVHVGHGLHYQNAMLMQKIPYLEEANIGHSIIANAVFSGMQVAVKEMKNLLNDKKYDL